jgi:hypothetical protein
MGYGNIDRIDQYFISSSRLVAHAVHGINPNRCHTPNLALLHNIEIFQDWGDLHQTNQFDQRLRSGINTAADASNYRSVGTSCEAISIFTI